ncbi:MAG: family N-acetyltransferase [Cyanobacteria bacterium RYN_339]|nr:family N-acetyltransferase [Cyanobacteria bacterium RYN_339]
MGIPQARAFLAAHADPVDDLLLWADASPPLGRLSRIWELRRGNEARALAFSFPLWPATPSLGIKGLSPTDEGEALAALVEAGVYHNGYVICGEAQVGLWQGTGHRELHMTLDAAEWRVEPRVGVREAGLAEIDAFYTAQGAEAWHPIQVETGPYVVVEEDGIVAAAGTHFAYPGLAQVGNVFTAPGARGRGLATRCTAAVVDRLVGQYPTISLFVDETNQAAIQIYSKLGFRARRALHAFPWTAERAL